MDESIPMELDKICWVKIQRHENLVNLETWKSPDVYLGLSPVNSSPDGPPCFYIRTMNSLN